MKLSVLGSGTSHGIPVIGCRCPVCCSEDPRDQRMRSSLYIEGRAGERAVIDTGPEFRLQAIRAGITRLDAVFLTHAHADHVHGLDDLRPLCREHHEKSMPVYSNRYTIEELRERFSYVFRHTQQGGGKPRINPQVIQETVRIGALSFTPIPVKHGILDIVGWKIVETRLEEGGAQEPAGEAVYLTDTSMIPDTSLDLIRSPDVLIIGGLRVRPHETHFTFHEALQVALQIHSPRVYITHICHKHSYQEIEAYCRTFQVAQSCTEIFMGSAYDGLELEV
ncbi:MAG: MBL fold metallo-hydrolase [Treponema sp.]|nr:MBL fold metallo-hydrolase [Treponema sp.]